MVKKSRKAHVERAVRRRVASVVPRTLHVDIELRGGCLPKKKCPSVRTKGKIDTGAGRSFIDLSVAKKLGLKRVGEHRAQGVLDAKAKPVATYGVDISFPGLGLKRASLMKYGAGVGRRRDDVLIGRDVMAASGMRLRYDAATNRFSIDGRR